MDDASGEGALRASVIHGMQSHRLFALLERIRNTLRPNDANTCAKADLAGALQQSPDKDADVMVVPEGITCDSISFFRLHSIEYRERNFCNFGVSRQRLLP